MQPDFSLTLPSSHTWAGKGQFSADGSQILALVNGGVVHFAPPLPNPYQITQPVNGAPGVPLNPTFGVSAPVNLGAEHAASQWQVRESSSSDDYAQSVFDSGATATALTSIVLPTGQLLPLTTYKARMRYRNSDGVWSEWSAETSFTNAGATGERIVFELDRDLWIMQADGSEPTKLTSGPANDRNPRFGPNGSTIAFSSDRDGRYKIWLMDPDGSNLRAVQGFDSANPITLDWSPGGTQLVAGSLGERCWLVNASGSGATLLAQHPLTQVRQGCLEPQNKIALALSPQNSPTQSNIYLVDPVSHGESLIAEGASEPAWSQDGGRLLYLKQGDLWQIRSRWEPRPSG